MYLLHELKVPGAFLGTDPVYCPDERRILEAAVTLSATTTARGEHMKDDKLSLFQQTKLFFSHTRVP